MKWNKNGEMITFDLGNNYSVAALIKWDKDESVYDIKTYLICNTDCTGIMYYMEDFDQCLDANKKNIYNIVAEYIQDLFDENQIKKYIKRYEFEQLCLGIGIELMEK